MIKTLYIGQFSKGTTSRMRGEVIKDLLKPDSFQVIDTHVPFYNTPRVYRSIGFRYKVGPLIANVNSYIKKHIDGYYDLIWVDKGIFIDAKTTQELRKSAKTFIYYTPDMSFFENKSQHFLSSIDFYDTIIYTKSRETEYYKKYVSASKLKWVSQGFSETIHKKYHGFEEKDDDVVFIGLAEKSRFEMISTLLEDGVKVKLVGKGWSSFVKNYENHENLQFLGESILDSEYSKLISSSKMALGLLSKRFPELHTTRTLEIPACGTALLTEKNEEICRIFDDHEVVFFKDKEDLVCKIKYYLSPENHNKLFAVMENGFNKVWVGGYSYKSIISNILEKIEL
ncbi:glycosyltransferase [Mangrovimonas sp. AS39]|uniref:glycosyltransferase family protein n=1 Tax=Mangrovimonas futianensis TaxID=2895523 RepID=UPI001E458D98|nr:glycosyltransferase [Mangrovimonas futianensis]MCF1194497.1 glycosyltransferase [Mangrovimonas futianensis]